MRLLLYDVRLSASGLHSAYDIKHSEACDSFKSQISFCDEGDAVALFKVVQQQTVGEVRNSIMRFWADNFLSAISYSLLTVGNVLDKNSL